MIMDITLCSLTSCTDLCSVTVQILHCVVLAGCRFFVLCSNRLHVCYIL